jgi:hypothetical protein
MKASSLLKRLNELYEEFGDFDVSISLDVSKDENDFDHRVYGDTLELWTNNDGTATLSAEMTEDNYA